jgi:hypothetical protein
MRSVIEQRYMVYIYSRAPIHTRRVSGDALEPPICVSSIAKLGEDWPHAFLDHCTHLQKGGGE